MILVTGSDGMLGRAVTARLTTLAVRYIGLPHNKLDIADPGAVDSILNAAFSHYDAVINCAGVRPDRASPIQTVRANALGPHILAAACKRYGARLFQISTDCVFTWDKVPAPMMFASDEQPSPTTLYGRTKLAGETGVVIRTSFVGPDHGVWRYIADQPRGATITGYQYAWWSGSTVREAARCIVKLVLNLPYSETPLGVYHLATAEPVTKYDAVRALAAHLGRYDLTIIKGGPRIDRSLAPTPGALLRPFVEALQAETVVRI